MTYAVEFQNVSRLYGDVRAVDGVSIGIRDGEFFSMLGPSGSGKTTCLRLMPVLSSSPAEPSISLVSRPANCRPGSGM